MDNRDKEEIINRYNERLVKLGATSDALAVGSEDRRAIRYHVLTELGNFNGKRILDLGCGFGDLLAFLKTNRIECEYTGYDINPELIKHARKKYPDGRFEVIDILSTQIPIFDYIVSSSSFNNKLKYGDNYSHAESILKKAYAHATSGVAIDFLTSYVDYRHDHAFYYAPEQVFTIAKKITRRVRLRHDYPLFEFCIYLYPDFDAKKIYACSS